jgi:hypothetical protein
LLKNPSLSKQEEIELRFAQARLEEDELRFRSAYLSLLPIKTILENHRGLNLPSQLSLTQFEYRLALLADLGGHPSAFKHYAETLRLHDSHQITKQENPQTTTKRTMQGATKRRAQNGYAGRLSQDLVLAAAERKVLLSANPWVQVSREKNRFRQAPEAFDSLLVQLVTRHPQWNELEKHTTSRTPVARTLVQRQKFLTELRKLSEEVRKIQSKTSTAAMAAQRIKQIQSVEDKVGQLVSRVQREQLPHGIFLAFDLKKLCLRKKTEVLRGAPLPKGLSPTERADYRNLLQGQINQLSLEIARLTQDQQKQLDISNWLNNLAQDHQTTSGGLRSLIRQELQSLAQAMKSDFKRPEAFVRATLTQEAPTQQTLRAERQRLIQNPQNKIAFENLKKLETQIGNPLFLQWVQARHDQGQNTNNDRSLQ